MPAPTPASAAASWVSNSGDGTTPQWRLSATRSSLALCITFTTAGSASIGASASVMPGASGSASRMLPCASSSAICTSASCGHQVRSRTNSVSRPTRGGAAARRAVSSAGSRIQTVTVGQIS